MVLLQGGTRSGKTYSIIYYLLDLCINHTGLEIDIVRDTLVDLKATAWADFEKVLKEHGYYDEREHNKSEHSYNLLGNKIFYYGADNSGKVHGRSRDILWINEAHLFDGESIDQLFPRTRHRIICDYNPALGFEHWIDKYILTSPLLISTYLDNPYLTKSQILDIEDKKDKKYWWSVYGNGNRSSREGVVFENWKIGEFDKSLAYCYGQDFGFNPDPTTLIKTAVNQKTKTIYLKECYYAESLSTLEISNRNKESIERLNDLIIADSAEPRLISEVRAKGLNIQRAYKPSIFYRINKSLEYNIVISPESKNLIAEMSKYIWSNKKSGIPIDKYNHGIDAWQYAFLKLINPKATYQSPIYSENLI